jgi:peptide/nickel transport system substrate-binding protein
VRRTPLRRRAPLAAPLAALLLAIGAATGACAADRLTVGMQLEPPVLDPSVNPAAAISEALYGNVFEGLVQFAPDGSVLPGLAESMR